MNLYTIEQKVEFNLRKAKFNGKYEFVKKMISLIEKDMPIDKVIAYLSEEIQEEWNELNRLEKYYENLG